MFTYTKSIVCIKPFLCKRLRMVLFFFVPMFGLLLQKLTCRCVLKKFRTRPTSLLEPIIAIMKKITLNILFILCSITSLHAQKYKIKIVLQNNEKWWCGIINHGQLMPFSAVTKYSNNLLGNNEGNQAQPLLLSNKGRYIWSEKPFQFSILDGEINVAGLGVIDTGKAGATLKEVQQYVRKKYFPSDGSPSSCTV